MSSRASLFVLLLLCWPAAEFASLFAQPAYSMERYETTGPDGPITILSLHSDKYLLEMEKRAVVAHAAAGESSDALLVAVWGPYVVDLLDRNGEPSPYKTGALSHYLHEYCHIETDRAEDKSRAMELEENGCYAERLVRYFSGDRLEYYVFEVLRESLDRPGALGFFRYPLLLAATLALTLPQLAVFLVLIGLFRRPLAAHPALQRAAKVILPLVLGIGWLFLFIYVEIWFGPYRGWMVALKMILPMSGVYFALTFLADMWIADRLFFPENDPPAWYWAALLYILAPLALLAGGAARGGSARGPVAARNSSDAGATPVGGGGTFGGGGASGRF